MSPLNIQGVLNSDSNYNNNNINNVTETVISASPISLNTVLYKITPEKKDELYGMTAHYIDKFKSLPIIRSQSGYSLTINKVVVRGGRKKELVQILPSTNVLNLRGDKKEKPNLIQLSVLVKKGNEEEKSMSIVVYYSGVVTISGGIVGSAVINNNARGLLVKQIDAIKDGIINKYFPTVSGTGKFSNISGQFKFTKQFSIEALSGSLPGASGITDVTRPELEMSLPKFQFKVGAIKCFLFPFTGTCQLFGATKLDQLTEARNKLLKLFKTSLRHTITGPAQVPVKRKVKPKAQKLKINKRAPGVARAGRLCPVSRRPDKTTGKCVSNLQFPKPNPQGDMCCYRIPKKKSDVFKQSVIKSYNDFNIPIPDEVQRTLEIGTADMNNNRATTKNIMTEFSVDPNGRTRIKDRLCTSLTKSQLIEFATKAEIIVNPDSLKGHICKAIYDEWRRKINAGAGLHQINILARQNQGYGGVKIEGKMCKYWTVKKLRDWATEHGIVIPLKMKKPAMCKLLFERANTNTRFDSTLMNRMPAVKVLNGTRVLIHNRNLNAYSNIYLKFAAEKLKIQVPANANKSDIIRRIYVKYTTKPTVSARGGKLKLMNRDASTYSRKELRQIIRKLPNVTIALNATAAQMRNAIFLTTPAGRQKILDNLLNKMPPHRRNAFNKRSVLTPDEKVHIIKKFPDIFKKNIGNVNTAHTKEVKNLKGQLANVKKNINWHKNFNKWDNNKTMPNNMANKMLNINDIDELKNESKALRRKLKRLEKKNTTYTKQEKILNTLYQEMLKIPGYKGKYYQIAKNSNLGAVSLAKDDLLNIIVKLLNKTPPPPNKTKNTKKSPPNKALKIRRAYNSYLKNGGPSNYHTNIAKKLGYSVTDVRKVLNTPVKSKVNKFNIEWFIDGNRKKIRVEAKNDDDINELAMKSNINNLVSRYTNRSLKKITINFKSPLSTNKDGQTAVKNATKKIRNILAKKIPSNMPMYI